MIPHREGFYVHVRIAMGTFKSYICSKNTWVTQSVLHCIFNLSLLKKRLVRTVSSCVHEESSLFARRPS